MRNRPDTAVASTTQETPASESGGEIEWKVRKVRRGRGEAAANAAFFGTVAGRRHHSP